MELPGGIYGNAGTLGKALQFKPLSGEDELSLWEAASTGRTRTSAISAVIDTVCEIDGPANQLCTTDQCYILAQLAQRFEGQIFWLSAECGDCAERFDMSIDLANLPTKPAADDYPFAKVNFGGVSFTFRMPVASDLEFIDEQENHLEAQRQLAILCQVKGPKTKFSNPQIEAISNALQDISPEIPLAIQSQCPECKTQNNVPIDIAAHVFSLFANPLEDVHDLASAYHWSEKDILALPGHRRRSYLKLIAADQGLAS